MNKLDYSISLRAKGLGSEEIKKKIEEKGFADSEIPYYLKKSDEIFLNQSIHYKGLKSKGRFRNILNTISLALTLLLLLSVFLGYVKIGLLGLVFLWSIVGFVSRR